MTQGLSQRYQVDEQLGMLTTNKKSRDTLLEALYHRCGEEETSIIDNLYSSLHMNLVNAKALAHFIVKTYSVAKVDDSRSISINKTANFGMVNLYMDGWQFNAAPKVRMIDKESGVVKYEIKISADGKVESVDKISGNVSAAQEKICIDALNNSLLQRADSGSSSIFMTAKSESGTGKGVCEFLFDITLSFE